MPLGEYSKCTISWDQETAQEIPSKIQHKVRNTSDTYNALECTGNKQPVCRIQQKERARKLCIERKSVSLYPRGLSEGRENLKYKSNDAKQKKWRGTYPC